jgi:hypothetical protein
MGGGEWSASFLDCFVPVEMPSIHWIGGLVGTCTAGAWSLQENSLPLPLNVRPSACSLVTSNWDIVAFCENVNNIYRRVGNAYLEMKLPACVLWHSILLCGCVPWHILLRGCVPWHIILLLHAACSIGHQCELQSDIFSAALFQVWHISVNLLKTVSTQVLRSAFCICLERKVPELNSHPGNISYCLVVFIYLTVMYLTLLSAVVWVGSRERMKPCSCDSSEHWMCL